MIANPDCIPSCLFILLCFFFTTACQPEKIPQSNFQYYNAGCSAPCQVNFINTSEGARAWKWNFGDGTTSTVENPSHVFKQPGSYTVELNSINEHGESYFEEQIQIQAGFDITKNLLAYYTFENRIPIDFSGNENHGLGAIDYVTGGPSGQGFAMDGLHSYFNIPPSAATKLDGPFSLTFWVKLGAPDLPETIYSQIFWSLLEMPQTDSLSHALVVNGTPDDDLVEIGLKIANQNATEDCIALFEPITSQRINFGEWLSISLVQSTNLSLYINGEFVVSTNSGLLAESLFNVSLLSGLKVGGTSLLDEALSCETVLDNPSENLFLLDNIRVYRRNISITEVQAIYDIDRVN